jgi:lipoprotein NlpD
MSCIKTLFQYVFLIGLPILFVACSTSKPAPIKDQSTPINQAKPVVIPNWSVANTPTPATNSTPATKPKSAPVKTTEAKPTESKQTKPAAEVPPPKTEPIVADPGFRIGKPSTAPVIDTFNGNSNKGIDYGGKMGDPVNAASDGKVIFSGNSLRSYGNLVIVKHNNNYITIYAHNSKNLVREGDTVKRGQKIAEMGNTESDRIKLHFELRRDSKPIDPTGYFDS